MKKLLLAVFAAELSLVAFPHTESEKLEVARRMTLFMHMSASYDNIDDLLANYREWSRPDPALLHSGRLPGTTSAENIY